jgi:hypothetical protein
MSGFGNGPFGSNPLGLASIAGLPEAPIKLVTSRSIDVNGKEAQDSDGNFSSMPDSHQRLLLALQLCEFPPLIGLDYEAAVDAEIRDKATVLGSDITITSIDVLPYVNGGRITVNFTDNYLNQPSSVTL